MFNVDLAAVIVAFGVAWLVMVVLSFGSNVLAAVLRSIMGAATIAAGAAVLIFAYYYM